MISQNTSTTVLVTASHTFLTPPPPPPPLFFFPFIFSPFHGISKGFFFFFFPFLVGFAISGSSPVASGTLVAKLGPVETSRVESLSTQQSVQPPQIPPLANQLSSQCRVETSSQSFSHFQESWLPKSDMCSTGHHKLQLDTTG